MSSMIAGMVLFIAGMFIITNHATSKAAWALILVGLVLIATPVRAHDHEHPELNEWYSHLMQPDVPTASCCGEADAYYCDDYFARDGKAYCRITDDRVVPGRPQVDVDTEIEIPPNKLKWDRGNPVGHSIVFLSRNLYVFCFVQTGGV